MAKITIFYDDETDLVMVIPRRAAITKVMKEFDIEAKSHDFRQGFYDRYLLGNQEIQDALADYVTDLVQWRLFDQNIEYGLSAEDDSEETMERVRRELGTS